MHIDHYSIITDIVKESKHADFTYIHDEADLLMDHYMGKGVELLNTIRQILVVYPLWKWKNSIESTRQ